MIVMPWSVDVPYTFPSGLTVPLAFWPMILPLVTTTALLLEPWQVTPTAFTIHAPSKLLLPPPPPLRDARRGSSASGWLRRAGLADSFVRVPDSDFSSLPMLPPALPDCAWTSEAPHISDIDKARSGIESRSVFLIGRCFQISRTKIQRPEPSAQTPPIIRQDLPALPHSSSAAFLACCAVSRWTSDHDSSEIANAPHRAP